MKRALPLTTLLLAAAPAATAFANADTRLPAENVIAAGSDAAYLIKPDGGVWAWGSNSAGQVGNGSPTTRTNPTSIVAGCTSISAGIAFTVCAAADGSLWSWGINGFGQLGRTGTTNVPMQVGTLMDYRTVEAGDNHALAIKYDGTLWAWGGNGSGQLGLNDTTKRTTPTKVGSASDWMALAAGGSFSLALKANGTLWGCGNNASGQMANGTTNAGPKTFTQIGTDRWTAISAGSGHVLAIKEDGTLWTWGLNGSYQVGNNSTASRTTPYQITTGSSTWRAVSAGFWHSMAIGSDGKLWGWGANTHGELGMGNFTSPKKTPGQVGTSRLHQYISAGQEFTMEIQAEGTLKTWGSGFYGALGNGGTADKNTAQQPWVGYDGDEFSYGVKPQVAGAGSFHSMLIARTGALETWGANGKGQLGDGTTNYGNGYYYPTVRQSDSDWIAATGGESCSHAIKSNGNFYAWGTNANGELGTTSVAQGGVKTAPYKIGTDSNWLKVQAHYAQVLVLKATGEIYASGDNFAGLLGVNSTTENIYKLTKVTTDAGKYWAAIAVSERNSYAIRTDGTLWAAGDNSALQLGKSSATASSKVFIQVGTATDWVAVGTGTNWGIAVKANGNAYVWGSAPTSAISQTATPTLVPGGYKFRLLATTRFSAIGAGAYGNILGFGRNYNGELGMGDTSEVTNMQPVGYWGSRSIAGGAAHFIEVNTFSTNGFSSGDGSSGQLGNGSTGSEYWPTQIYY